MTMLHSPDPVVTDRLRAKDVQMRASVDETRRLVLVTGAIDTNDHVILARVALPAPGRWQVIKSETNLTDRTWRAWQVGFGAGTTASVEEPHHASRQYASTFVPEDRSRVTFHDGEVRPGEPILKMFTVECAGPELSLTHNRYVDEPDEPELPEAELELAVVAGLPAKPVLEVYMPADLV